MQVPCGGWYRSDERDRDGSDQMSAESQTASAKKEMQSLHRGPAEATSRKEGKESLKKESAGKQKKEAVGQSALKFRETTRRPHCEPAFSYPRLYSGLHIAFRGSSGIVRIWLSECVTPVHTRAIVGRTTHLLRGLQSIVLSVELPVCATWRVLLAVNTVER